MTEQTDREYLGLEQHAVERICSILEGIRDELDSDCHQETCEPEDDDCQGCTDVRLQIDSDGDWSIHSGSAQYDQDHRGYWGSSIVSKQDSDADLQEIVADLMSQAAEQAAMADADLQHEMETQQGLHQHRQEKAK